MVWLGLIGFWLGLNGFGWVSGAFRGPSGAFGFMCLKACLTGFVCFWDVLRFWASVGFPFDSSSGNCL